MKSSIQYILVVLLSLNLAATIWIGFEVKSSTSNQSLSNQSKQPLPEHISKLLIKELSDKFIEAYNNKDMDACWNLFGDYAQAQMVKNDIGDAVEKLDKLLGPVISADYLYFEYLGDQGNLDFYKFYYVVKLTDKSTLSDKGELQITVADDGKKMEMVKFHLTSIAE